MTQWSRRDYDAIARVLRGRGHGSPPDATMDDVMFAEQDILEALVDDFCVVFRVDNARFDANRFRMAALGYLTTTKGEDE